MSLALQQSESFEILPNNVHVIGQVGKKVLLQKNKHLSRFKTTKAVRDKIAVAAKKIKIPVFTVAINTPPVLATVFTAHKYWQEGWLRADPKHNSQVIMSELIAPYFAFSYHKGENKWKMDTLPYATIGNIGIKLVSKAGIFKGTNQKLANMRVPFRLA